MAETKAQAKAAAAIESTNYLTMSDHPGLTVCVLKMNDGSFAVGCGESEDAYEGQRSALADAMDYAEG